ncbi:hypothetical protein J3454_04715 [Erythrobacter sp. NFXS35]|uniref:hypothetical protein n=1 Tax=Erythrobacter sp. NFXS35 TaxID=2818436 RepID=UPI0032DEA295
MAAARHLAYRDRDWAPQPHADTTLREWLESRLARNDDAAALASRLMEGAAIRLRDLVDHVVFTQLATRTAIEAAGWAQSEPGVWRNPAGMFPPFVAGDAEAVWLRVESVEQFVAAHNLSVAIEGEALAPLRRALALPGEAVSFGVLERGGSPALVPQADDPAERRTARITLQRFRARRRQFDTVEQGLAHTEALVDSAIADLGSPHRACALWLLAEREYWQSRCHAARVQKARQDAVGVGWANIDHHTYDSSRAHYQHTIAILEKLGYELREMLYAGDMAGWGSQVLEQPVIGSTIFADVDLAPHEVELDFAHESLPPLDKHRRAGILCALHGESILEQGLNHVACFYDSKAMRDQMAGLGIRMMPPFSDMPHLYQELTHGDWAAVDPARVDALEADGHLPADEAQRIRMEGAIVTHLENIERNDGYKGFNKPGIDGVLQKLDPRRYGQLKAEQAAAG